MKQCLNFVGHLYQMLADMEQEVKEKFYQLGNYSLFAIYRVGKIIKCQLLLIGTSYHSTAFAEEV